MTAASINVAPFWPGLSAEALAHATLGASSARQGLVGLPQQPGLHQQEVLPPPLLLPSPRKESGSKERRIEESDDDMGCGVFD